MWAKQSHLLQPLTALTSNKVRFRWKFVEHKSFNKIKRIVVCDNSLIYTDFNKRFDIHMDASEFQLGAVIIQDGKTIALYSRRLTGPQTRYTVTEK